MTVSPNLSQVPLKRYRTSSVETVLLVENLILTWGSSCLLSCLSQFGSVCLFLQGVFCCMTSALVGRGVFRGLLSLRRLLLWTETTGTFLKTCLVAGERSWAHMFLSAPQGGWKGCRVCWWCVHHIIETARSALKRERIGEGVAWGICLRFIWGLLF